MFIAEVFIITQPKCPLADTWIKQLWDIYTMVIKKNILPFATLWMDIMLSEISQSEKDKYHIISLNLFNLMNKLN